MKLMKKIIKQFTKLSNPIAFLIIILALGNIAFAQTKSKGKSCPIKKKATKKTNKNYKKAEKKRVNVFPTTNLNTNFSFANKLNFNSYVSIISEKSIKVHPRAYVTLCVTKGNVKVNGWNRNEARIFVKGTKKTPIGFEIREKSSKDKTPLWVQVVGYDKNKRSGRHFNNCLSGDIELDVPKGASIKIQNTKGESETTVDSVRIAKVEVLGGDIYLNNIADRINANTFQGGVTVRNSSGKMALTTTTGNIVAHNTHSHEIGDYFKAKTRSGAITLQSVDQKEVESSSVSGSINYVGRIRDYGKYDFDTTNGSINLAIPKSSSCQLVMAYGGAFESELPLNDLFKERSGSLVFLRAKMGKGKANLNLKSFNGTIRIREKKQSVLASF